MMNNIYQFNNLQLKHALLGTPSPSKTASLEAAQSALNQRSLTKSPPNPRSGFYHSCSIQKEAKHIINNQHLLGVKRGNRKTHQSLLDNVELQKVLFNWAASQVPGHGSHIYLLHTASGLSILTPSFFATGNSN